MTEPIAPGRVLGGRYELVRPIARGGMASVWEGQDPLLSRRVAVKILDAQLGTDDALRARFRHEAVAAARLAHPNIVATYDTGEDEGVAFIVMELVDGRTLRELLDAQGALPVGEAVDLTMQVAAALTHAHEHGLVHRDVKPGNVLVQPAGHVKVTDFGIAKATDTGSELTRAGAVMGTARYLAPEQLGDGEVDARADVYSLALVLYELLAGRPPFTAESDVATAVARLTADPSPVSDIRPDVPPGLDAAISHALARDPVDRTPTARAFREAITRYRGAGTSGEPDATRPVVIPGPGSAPARGRRAGAVSPTPPKPRTSVTRRVLGAMVLFAVGIGIGYAGFRAADRSSTSVTTTTTLPAPVPLTVTTVKAFDPIGGDGEDDAEAPNVNDRSAGTTWSTESYATANLGGKAGVGLQLTLDASHPVDAVAVDAVAGPWNAAVYVSDTPFTRAPSGPAPGSATNLGTTARISLTPPAAGKYVLLWITRLPLTGTGVLPYRLTISEARVLGS